MRSNGGSPPSPAGNLDGARLSGIFGHCPGEGLKCSPKPWKPSNGAAFEGLGSPQPWFASRELGRVGGGEVEAPYTL